MNNSYSVEAVLKATGADQFASDFDKAKKSLGGMEGATKKSASGLKRLAGGIAKVAGGIGVTKLISAGFNAVRNSIDGAVTRVDTLNQFPRILEQMGYSTDEATKATERLSDGIQGLPTRLDEVVGTTQRFVTAFGDVELATESTLALNNALLASGADAQGAANATDQYVKALSSGKLEMDTWNTLSEQMSYALSEVATDLGIADGDIWKLYDSIKEGEITLEEFNQAMIDASNETGGFAETALTASEGIRTSWKNINTAVTTGVANVIQAINDWMKDAGLGTIADQFDGIKTVVQETFGFITTNVPVVLNALASLFNTVKNSTVFNALKDAVQGAFEAMKTLVTEFDLKGAIDQLEEFTGKWAPLVAGITAAIATVVAYNSVLAIKSGIETVAIATLYALEAAQAFVNAAMLAFRSTLGLTAIAIGILVAAGVWLYQNWDMVSEKARQLARVVPDAWRRMQDAVIDSAESIEESIASFMSNSMQIIGDVWNGIYKVWQNALTSIFSTNNKYLNNMLMALDKIMMESWMIVEAVWTYIETTVSNAVGFITALVTGDFAVMKDFIEQQMIATQEVISNVWGSIVGIFEGQLSYIKNFTLGIFEELATETSGIWSTIAGGILGALERLSAGFQTLRETVEELWSAFENTAVFGLISGAIDNVIGRVVSFKDAIVSLVQDFDFQPMLEQVLQFIPKLIGIFISKKAGMILGGANIIHAIAEGMGMTAPELIQMVADTLIQMIEEFSAALPGYVEQGTEMIIAFIDGIVAQIPMLTELAIGIIMTLVEGLLGSIMTIVEAGITLITALMEGIVMALPQIVEVIIQLVTTLIGAIIVMLPILIQTGIQLLMALIEGIISALPMIIEAVILLFTTLLEAFVAMLPVIIEAGIQLLMALIEGIITMLPMIIEAGIQLLMALIEGIISMLPMIIEAGITLIITLFEALITMMPTIVDAGMSVLMALIEGIIGMLPALIEVGIQLIISLAEAFISVLPTIIEAGITLLMALIEGIIQVLPALISAGIQLIVALGGAIIQMVPTIISAGIQILGALVSGILSVIGQLLSAGAELMSSLLSEILSFLGQMLSAGGDLITSLIDGIKNVIGDVVTAVGDGITDAWEEVKSFGSKFKEAGSNIIGNIAEGISGAIGKVTGAVGNVLSAARDLLPFSPPKDKSSPMVGLEKNGIIDNIVQGIYDSESDIQKAMNSALDVDMPMVNGRVNHSVNMNNGRTENLLEQLLSRESDIYLDGDTLVGGTYSRYDRVGGNQTQLTERWGR